MVPVLLFATAPQAEAPAIVRQLVDERLVACGNILPGARSIYRWDGKVEDESEAVIFMETRDELVKRAMARFAELHSYDVPKVMVFETFDVWGAYGTWLNQATAVVGDDSGPSTVA